MERKAFYVLAFLVVIFKSEVQGLKCYSCVYISTDPPDALQNLKIEQSCKAGGKPDKSLLIDCGNSDIYSDSEHRSSSEADKQHYTCGMYTLDGKMVEGGAKLKATARACLRGASTRSEPFTMQTLQGERYAVIRKIKDPELRDYLIHDSRIVDDNTKTTFSTCSKDGCNKGNGAMPYFGFGVFAVIAVMTHYIMS